MTLKISNILSQWDNISKSGTILLKGVEPSNEEISTLLQAIQGICILDSVSLKEFQKPSRFKRILQFLKLDEKVCQITLETLQVLIMDTLSPSIQTLEEEGGFNIILDIMKNHRKRDELLYIPDSY